MKHPRTVRFLSLFWVLFAFVGCTDSGTEGGPTVLLQGVPNGVFEVGSVLSITVSAEGIDGGDLDFKYDWKPKSEKWTVGDRATFLTQGKSALFSWDPLASDATNGVPIQLVFIVTDQSGRRTEKTASVEIVAGNGKPVFSSNVSEIFDPRTGEGLSFEVKVKDQDSAEVDLTMDETTAPIGAKFEKTGPYSGTFTWKPNANQLDKRIRTVRFIADDKQFEEVNHDVTIVVRKNQTVDLDKDQTKAQCPDERVITHVPLGPQYSLENYRVEATVSASSGFEEVILFWTTADAYNADFDRTKKDEKLNSVPMIENGGVYSAEILSQAGAIEPGKFADISYQICGINKQAQVATNSIICTPSSGKLEMFNTFIAYRDEGTCVEDTLDANTVGDDTIETSSLVNDSWDTRHTCTGSPDYFSTLSQPGEKSFLGVTFNKGADLDLSAVDKDGNSLPLEFSPCTGLATLDTSVPVGDAPKSFYIKASGNDAVYHVRKFTTSTGNAGDCNDTALEPNDSALSADVIANGDNFDAEICKADDIDIYKIDLKAGDEITINHKFVHAVGSLDMTLFSPEQVDEVGTTSASGVALTFTQLDEEMITYTALLSGPYYLQVFNNAFVTKTPYNLDIKVQPGAACSDSDEFEVQNNHTQGNAAILASIDSLSHTGLDVCPGNADWYKRTEFNGVFFFGEIKITGGEGTIDDVEWEIFDLQQTSLAKATKNGSALEMEFTPTSTGGVFHKITTTKKVDYSLELLR